MRRLTLSTALALAAAAPALAQEAPELTFTATELNGGIVMLDTGMAGNLAVLPGPDGVLLVDDQLPGTGPQVEAAIAEHAEDGVPRFILNTHWHGDHTGSNAHFAAQGTTVVAHDNIRVRLADSEDEWAQDPNILPLLTFGQDITFHMNGQTIEVTHVPNAHTDGDAFVYFREADVLHMGDVMFNQRFPFIDLTSGGSVDGYIGHSPWVQLPALFALGALAASMLPEPAQLPEPAEAPDEEPGPVPDPEPEPEPEAERDADTASP